VCPFILRSPTRGAHQNNIKIFGSH
jgi:hypothetical protein